MYDSGTFGYAMLGWDGVESGGDNSSIFQYHFVF